MSANPYEPSTAKQDRNSNKIVFALVVVLGLALVLSVSASVFLYRKAEMARRSAAAARQQAVQAMEQAERSQMELQQASDD